MIFHARAKAINNTLMLEKKCEMVNPLKVTDSIQTICYMCIACLGVAMTGFLLEAIIFLCKHVSDKIQFVKPHYNDGHENTSVVIKNPQD